MITYKCKNCAGEMTIHNSGSLVCPYCGTKDHFTDKNLAAYKAFRRHMLEFLTVGNSTTHSDIDYIWSTYAETKTFVRDNGQVISVKYIYTANHGNCEYFVGRKSVIYIYPTLNDATKAINNLKNITLPGSADSRLNKCIPTTIGTYILNDGRAMVAYEKDENYFPLAMYGNLPYEHTAWLISRFENIACLFEFNNRNFGEFVPDTIFVNHREHTITVYGNWLTVSAYDGTDLKDFRALAKKILGENPVPEGMAEFLDNPSDDAYDDFEAWDNVITTKLGGRHFHELKIL